MHIGMTLLIISAVLGGLVVILGAIYAYIYYTRINRRHRPIRDEHHLRNQSSSAQQDSEEKRPFHPFLILSYAAKVKRDNDAS